MVGRGAASRGHRRLLLLTGSGAWCRRAAGSLLDEGDHHHLLWVTAEPWRGHPAVTSRQLPSMLGDELEALVFDAWSGFDPDAFGAAAGMVRGGGTVLVLAPPLAEWPRHPDPALQRITPWPHDYRGVRSRFLQRLVGLIGENRSILTVTEGDPLPELRPPAPAISGDPDVECRTTEQQQAVEAICRVVRGHRRRPLVLSADRGRGKSSALGIASARLLREGREQILVTAPSPRAASALFRQARRLLPGSRDSGHQLRWNRGTIGFVAPDALLAEPRQADLLLVDEAAAIPAPMLETLLRRHSRIAFATTIHGYEGTGRGFAVRFWERLDRLAPGWRTLHISSPIRWEEGDPVERFTFRALLLDASPADDREVSGAAAGDCAALELDRDRLLNDESLLEELFGLLVLAHYRTRPSDLRNLLDCPDLSVYALLHDGHLAAAALVMREGGMERELAERIWLGRRRVHGHLLAQSLAFHAGFPEAATLRYARIMRLAVHPSVQRRGLGTRLVTAIAEREERAGLDAIGTSFGATPGLLEFWHRLQFRTARMGLRREASSGSRAALMLRPLSRQGAELCRAMWGRLQEQLPELLRRPLNGLEPETAWHLLQNLPPPVTTLTPGEWRDAASFAFGRRSLQSCLASLRKLVIATATDRDAATSITAPDRERLIRQIVQEQGNRKETSPLREAVRRLLEHSRPQESDTQQLLNRLFTKL